MVEENIILLFIPYYMQTNNVVTAYLFKDN